MNILFWPFKLVWSLIGLVFELTGRMISAILGIVLMVIGIILTITIVGAVLGIILITLGFLLLIRAIF